MTSLVRSAGLLTLCWFVASCGKQPASDGGAAPAPAPVPAPAFAPSPGDDQAAAPSGGASACVTVRREEVTLQAGATGTMAVTLDEAGTYVVALAGGEETDPMVRITDGRGELLAENDDFRNDSYCAAIFAVDKPQSVTLETSCYEDAAGTAILRVQRIGSIAPGKRVSAELTAYDEWHFYAFTADKGKVYQFRLKDLSTGCDPMLGLHDGTTLDGLEYDEAESDDDEILWKATESGDYVLTVTMSTLEGSGTYTVECANFVEN